MSLADALLKRIENEMADAARQALISPQGRDAFEYGRMVGMYGGMAHVRALLLTLCDEEDEKNI